MHQCSFARTSVFEYGISKFTRGPPRSPSSSWKTKSAWDEALNGASHLWQPEGRAAEVPLPDRAHPPDAYRARLQGAKHVLSVVVIEQAVLHGDEAFHALLAFLGFSLLCTRDHTLALTLRAAQRS